MKNLILKFKPDYIVGSIHHVDDICFDYSKEEYDRLSLKLGSYDLMYEKYFDLQYEMINNLKPFIVGHFDLIRIFDQDYKNRLALPEINQKIIRNLELIKSLNLVMDFNLRPLARGEKEPYITASILKTRPCFPLDSPEMTFTVSPFLIFLFKLIFSIFITPLVQEKQFS